MSEKHRIAADGYREDGVSTYPADAHDIQTYSEASQALSEFHIPILLRDIGPNDRLFVACFDGTGNDKNSNPEHATNIAHISDAIESLPVESKHRIKAAYVEGPGTQRGFIASAWDGARGHTYEERMERMYVLLADQVKRWKDEDPDAEIRVASIGFSRGAEQAAGFTRLLHERGIQDSEGVQKVRNARDQVVGTTYTLPPLVPPGQTPQVVALIDPVGTGEPVKKHDRRLPPSVISGIQLIAEDERRSLFKATHIIDPGPSDDGRFLGMVVAGAHSDLGGGYHRNGLSLRSGNLVMDYLNRLSDTPFLQRRAEPDDPRLNVVHRSEEGMLVYRATSKVDRLQAEGHLKHLVPEARLQRTTDGYNAEVVDERMKGGFEFHGTRPETPPSHEARLDPLSWSDRAPVFRNPFAMDALNAVLKGDDDAFMRAAHRFSDSAEGQRLDALANELLQQERTRQRAQEADAQPMPARGRSL